MELQPEPLLQAAIPKLEAVEERQSSCKGQTSSAGSPWGDYDGSGASKRHPSNGLDLTPPLADEEDNFLPKKKIKSEPKDDYALAEEECARNASQISRFTLNSDFSDHEVPWAEERNNSGSPVFDRVPSFAANECHKYNSDNCKQCIINQSQPPGLSSISLHRRRQIREFEQSGEEPLSNKIRVWKEKRLEKSFVRGKVPFRIDEETLLLELKKRKEQMEGEESRQHHMNTRSRQMSSETECEENGTENADSNFGYLRYLLTRGQANCTSPESAGEENMIEEQQGTPVLLQDKEEQTIVSMPLLPSTCGVQEAHAQNGQDVAINDDPDTTVEAAKISKPSKKRPRQNSSSNFVPQQSKSPKYQENPASRNKIKGSARSRNKSSENGVEHGDEFNNNISSTSNGEFEETNGVGLPHENFITSNEASEQYISDIQRPYCNIPDDHQVTHINGVMSLPATRETRYGITLGELKRRTGYPEFLTRVDLIAYVRQSKSAGRALLDKYNIATAGQKSHPTILSKMCENEARVLGDGINRMNAEYFPWKTLARTAANRTTDGKVNDGKVDQKIKAIQSTRTMLKEIYDLMVEEKEIPTMKTFEVASHTFGTANILNHLTVFDRLFEEYQSNLIFRQDVRNNNRKL